MTGFVGLRPKPYVPLCQDDKQDSSEVLERPPQIILKRRYSQDRLVDRRPDKMTLQQARKQFGAAVSNQHQKQSPDENGGSAKIMSNSDEKQLAKLNFVHEWDADEESFTLNMRPGHNMFPFLKNRGTVKDDDGRDDDEFLIDCEKRTLPRHFRGWTADETAQQFLFETESGSDVCDRFWTQRHEICLVE